ncbi:MAG: ROK family protein [Oligoflexales bacterium]
MALFLGLDVGGTKVEAALVTDQGEVLRRDRVPTMREKGYEDLVQRVGQLCLSLGLSDIEAVGIGIPGVVCPETNVMLQGGTGILREKPFATDLLKIIRKETNIKDVFCENDANCFVLAEAITGAGKGLGSGLGVILGTGVGGGYYDGNHLLRGARGCAAEVGHMILMPGGRPCFCSKRGCAEQYLSGPGVESSYPMYSQIHKRPDASEIFLMAGRGEPGALAVVEEYRKNLADFLANMTNLYDPHYIVLGGGMSREEIIYQGLEDRVARRGYLKISPKIMQHSLGDSAGVIGAALLPLHGGGPASRVSS